MSRLIIKSLTIVDYEHRKANIFKFSEGANLIVSKRNRMGKSSLVKSLFYALGASVKSFPKGWEAEKYIYQLEIQIKDKIYRIKRHNKVISIKSEDESKVFTNFFEYSQWIQNTMDMKLELINKNSVSRKTAYIEAVLIPFYIDQDKGWSGSIFRETFEGLGGYDSKHFPKDVIDYYLDISDSSLQEKEAEALTIKQKKTVIKNEIDQIQYVYENYKKKKSITEATVTDIDELKLELNQYVTITNKLTEDVRKTTNQLEDRKRKLDILQQDKEEMELLLKAINKRFNEIKHKCTYCHSSLTREQSLTRLELDDNRLMINAKKEELIQEILETQNEIEGVLLKLESLREKFDYYHSRLKEIKSISSIKDYIGQNVLNELKNFEHELVEKENAVEKQLKDLNKEIKELRKTMALKIENLSGDFEKIKNELCLVTQSSGIMDRKFNDFKKFNGSGMYLNKEILILYLSYMNLIIEKANFKFPCAIDSFVKNEADKHNLETMFEAINSYFLTLETQTFFSIIEENLKYIDKGYNQVEIEAPLLSKDKYIDIEKTIIEIDEKE